MESLGQKLEQARKQHGFSLKDAAEATKIRTDILSHFEQSNFQFDLPEVYKRGFLRVYARWLQLDPTEIMQDYAQATQTQEPLQRPRLSEQTLKRELYGQMNLEDDEETQDDEQDVAEKPSPNRIPLPYAKIGAICVSILLLILGSVLFFRSDTPESETQTSSEQAPVTETIRLIATGDVYVVVRQELDKEKLYVGPLKKGDQIEIEKKGPVKIQHTAGENLFLEKNGRRYGMSANGLAVSQFD